MTPKKEKPQRGKLGHRRKSREPKSAIKLLESKSPNCQAKFGQVVGLHVEVRS